MPLVANGFPYDATVYDGHCNKIRYVNMFNGFTASITSRLPWTVEVRLADGAGGYEPLAGSCLRKCDKLNESHRLRILFASNRI